ncbi:MAG TPA: adenylosuccinate synthetase [Candidatus Paceibacterota bacterium]|jgi:adenylosuccinate synthase|nr:adenylosuccinate synthetase [Candidatus Paceibacterota bacterium]
MATKILKKKKARPPKPWRRRGFIDVVVGLQWGDEGKGKNIDQLLSHRVYSGVARFQGGANAGHTLKYGGKTFVGHIVPSGCLHKNIDLYIGNGVVVDVVSLIKEIGELKKLGFNIVPRLYISNRAKLVSYMHPILDAADEHKRNKLGNKIGTTNRGIGPVYSDVRARRALLLGDIILPDFDKKLTKLSEFHMNTLGMYEKKYGFKIDRKK